MVQERYLYNRDKGSFFLSLPSLKNQFMEITTISINSSVFHTQLFKALGYGYGLVVKAPAVQA